MKKSTKRKLWVFLGLFVVYVAGFTLIQTTSRIQDPQSYYWIFVFGVIYGMSANYLLIWANKPDKRELKLNTDEIDLEVLTWAAPVQIIGTAYGKKVYFRARHSSWSFYMAPLGTSDEDIFKHLVDTEMIDDPMSGAQGIVLTMRLADKYKGK